MIGSTTDRPTTTSASASEESQQSSFLKWAGWSGVVGTLAFIVTVFMTFGGVASPDGPQDVLRFLEDVAAGGPVEYVYGVAGIVLVFLYVPMAIGIYRLLDRSVGAWYGSAAVVLGLMVLLPAYVINLLAPMALVPLAADLGSAGANALYADYQVARVVAEIFFTVGSVLTLSFGPLLWGVSWLRSQGSRRWIGWTAVLTGITGLVWFVWLIDNVVFANLLIANVLLSLVLFTAASVTLLSRSRLTR